MGFEDDGYSDVRMASQKKDRCSLNLFTTNVRNSNIGVTSRIYVRCKIPMGDSLNTHTHTHLLADARMVGTMAKV